MVQFRKRSFKEYLVIDMITLVANVIGVTLLIKVYAWLGVLEYLSIGTPTWAQAMAVAFIWSALPLTRASRYEEVQ